MRFITKYHPEITVFMPIISTRPVLLAPLAVLLCMVLPAFSKDFSARDLGAAGDGIHLDSPAIQKAIDAAYAAGGGRVVLAAGTYRSGSIKLKDKVDLHLEQDAVLLGSNNLADYQRGNWPALILAQNVRYIAITGKGTLDGNSPELVKTFDRTKASGNALDFTPWAKPGEAVELIGPTGSPMRFNPHELHEQGKLMDFLHGKLPRPYEYVRPQIIEMQNCKRVILRDITIRNAACWVQTYRSCEDMLFERITVRSTSYWNNDGVDIVDCRRVKILDCDIDSADDALCLKSDPPGPGCEDITVERCKLASRASAIKFGTGSHHCFKRIHTPSSPCGANFPPGPSSSATPRM
jgi:polygalacturonase